jgi:hypothetical protein
MKIEIKQAADRAYIVDSKGNEMSPDLALAIATLNQTNAITAVRDMLNRMGGQLQQIQLELKQLRNK